MISNAEHDLEETLKCLVVIPPGATHVRFLVPKEEEAEVVLYYRIARFPPDTWEETTLRFTKLEDDYRVTKANIGEMELIPNQRYEFQFAPLVSKIKIGFYTDLGELQIEP